MKQLFEDLKYSWLFVFVTVFLANLMLIRDSWIIYIIVFIWLFRLYRLQNRATWFMILICVSLSLGHHFYHQSRLGQISRLELNHSQVELILEVDPFDISFSEDNLRGRARAHYNHQGQNYCFWTDIIFWHQGEFVASETVVTQPSYWKIIGKFEKADIARNFGVFDYHQYLQDQQIYWQVEIEALDQVIANQSIEAKIKALRNYILQFYRQKEDQEWVALHNKVLLNMDSSTYKSFKHHLLDLGILHLFAISGFHLQIIQKIINYLLLRFGLTIKWTQRLTLIYLVAYLWLIYWPIGILRAFLVMLIKQLRQFLLLPLSSMDSLAIVGILFLFFQPHLVVSYAYILSFLMTIVIEFYSQKKINKPSWQKALEMSALCCLFSWPITIQMNYTWNVSQIWIITLLSYLFSHLLMPLFLASNLLLCLPEWLIQPGLNILNRVIQLMYQLYSECSFMNISKMTVGYLPIWLVCVLWSGGCYYLYHLHTKRNSKYWYPFLLYLGLYLFPWFNPSVRINLIDVDQGDAILYRRPHNQGTWLIDTGGRNNFRDNEIDKKFAYRNIIPGLRALGVRQLDGIIISHLDADHVGNLPAILDEFQVSEIFIGENAVNDPFWQSIKNEHPRQVVNYLCLGGHYYLHNDIQLYSLPLPQVNFTDYDVNDASIVAQINFGSCHFLSLGDLSQTAEKELLNLFPEIKGDIVKLAHHGSRHSCSTELLDKLQPKLTVNSAGESNRYQHPHQEVLAKLFEYQIPLYCTSQHGAVEIAYYPWDHFEIETKINRH